MTTSKGPTKATTCSNILLNFTISWFTMNMATGTLSVILYIAPHQFHGMKTIATIFYVMNCVLFIIFFLISVLRYICFPYTFKRLIHHPAQSMFIGSFPVALATIINATVLIAVPAYGQRAINLAWALWWIDIVLSLFSCLGVPFMMFNSHQIKMEKMTAMWLLPILPTIVAPATGGLVSSVLPPEHAVITIILSYALWGLGVGLSILIMALYLYRLTIYKLPEAEIIASAFLPLSPLGQGGFGLMQLAIAARKNFPLTDLLSGTDAGEIIYVISIIVALLMWGWGLWWFVHGITSVLVRFITGKIPFSLRFWGFIFPVGVYTTATILLGKLLPSAFFSYLSMVFTVCVVILWILITLRTIRGIVNLSIFVAPEVSDMKKRLSKTTDEDLERSKLKEPLESIRM